MRASLPGSPSWWSLAAEGLCTKAPRSGSWVVWGSGSGLWGFWDPELRGDWGEAGCLSSTQEAQGLRGSGRAGPLLAACQAFSRRAASPRRAGAQSQQVWGGRDSVVLEGSQAECSDLDSAGPCGLQIHAQTPRAELR